MVWYTCLNLNQDVTGAELRQRNLDNTPDLGLLISARFVDGVSRGVVVWTRLADSRDDIGARGPAYQIERESHSGEPLPESLHGRGEVIYERHRDVCVSWWVILK